MWSRRPPPEARQDAPPGLVQALTVGDVRPGAGIPPRAVCRGRYGRSPAPARVPGRPAARGDGAGQEAEGGHGRLAVAGFPGRLRHAPGLPAVLLQHSQDGPLAASQLRWCLGGQGQSVRPSPRASRPFGSTADTMPRHAHTQRRTTPRAGRQGTRKTTPLRVRSPTTSSAPRVIQPDLTVPRATARNATARAQSPPPPASTAPSRNTRRSLPAPAGMIPPAGPSEPAGLSAGSAGHRRSASGGGRSSPVYGTRRRLASGRLC